MLCGEGSGGASCSPGDSLHRALEFLNPHKSFILVRKYCFDRPERRDETGGNTGTCLKLPAVPLEGASFNQKKP